MKKHIGALILCMWLGYGVIVIMALWLCMLGPYRDSAQHQNFIAGSLCVLVFMFFGVTVSLVNWDEDRWRG